MVRAHSPHLRARNLGGLAPLELFDVEPRPAQDRPGAARRDHTRAPAEETERGDVEVIVMQVGDQDRVDVARDLGDRPVTDQIRDAPAKDRIGEQAGTTELEQQGGVADVRDPVRRYGRECPPDPGVGASPRQGDSRSPWGTPESEA
jgi:hypothetical protein